MDYYRFENALQAVIDASISLSSSQKGRIKQACEAVLLAGSSEISWIARWLPQTTSKDSRNQWLSRLLKTRYLCQEFVYEPFVKKLLKHHNPAQLHVLMDRTPFVVQDTDLVSISLNFRKRAIALGWEFMPHGMSGYDLQTRLIERCYGLLPSHIPIIFHGDCEFGSVRLMQYLQDLDWDFMVGQSSKNYYRSYPHGDWQTFGDLAVTKTRSIYLEDVEVTKTYGYGLVNIFAFYKPRFGKKRRKQDIIYCATSLPTAPTLRCTGHRRWGVECQFRDMKSSGWNVQNCHISDPKHREGLLTLLNMSYLWATSIGRWLCKTSQRRLVDAKSKRHLSLFRIGWDWLVNQYRTERQCPALLRLYQ
jgi:hypothetical protein